MGFFPVLHIFAQTPVLCTILFPLGISLYDVPSFPDRPNMVFACVLVYKLLNISVQKSIQRSLAL